jgi:hypothetical protein
LWAAREGVTGSSSDEVRRHRLAAAEATRGIRADSIDWAVQRVILNRELRGKALDFGAGAGNLARALVSMRRFAEISAADIMPARPARPPCSRAFRFFWKHSLPGAYRRAASQGLRENVLGSQL